MDDLEYGTELHALLKNINNFVMGTVREVFASIGITHSQSIAMMLIADAGGQMSGGELSGKMNTPASNATNICNRLERMGLLEKLRGKSDRRVVTLRLTDKGHALVGDIVSRHRQLLLKIAQATPDAQRGKILEGLRLLNDSLGEKAPSESLPFAPPEKRLLL